MVKKSFNIRSFLSLGTFLFFMLLAVSGIGLHIFEHKPPTFVLAYFKSSHTIFGFIFLSFSFGHILTNWKAIKSYIRSEDKKIFSKEMLASLIITTIILFITLFKAIEMAKEHGIQF